MFLRTSPAPSILSRGSRYLLRAPGCRHFSLPRPVVAPSAAASVTPVPVPAASLYKNPATTTTTTTAWTASSVPASHHSYSTAHTAEEEASAMADASETGVTADSIRGKLIDQLQAQYVEIEDLSGGCGQAFMAIIVSPQFAGKNMLARHRLVNAALKSEIAAIHAWTPKCYTPEQWQSLQQ